MLSNIFRAVLETPIGFVQITSADEFIVSVEFVDSAVSKASKAMPSCLRQCVSELTEYFEGKRSEFTVKLDQKGTAFQLLCWQQLKKIPYGETISYREEAVLMGNRNAVRAVALANKRNPIPIIVPCHRVIGSSGKLVGYGGGLWRKGWLLNHEAAHRDLVTRDLNIQR